jgi:hypothetical protein
MNILHDKKLCEHKTFVGMKDGHCLKCGKAYHNCTICFPDGESIAGVGTEPTSGTRAEIKDFARLVLDSIDRAALSILDDLWMQQKGVSELEPVIPYPMKGIESKICFQNGYNRAVQELQGKITKIKEELKITKIL